MCTLACFFSFADLPPFANILCLWEIGVLSSSSESDDVDSSFAAAVGSDDEPARALELDAATATPPAKQKSIATSGRRPRRMASRIRSGSTCASSKNRYSGGIGDDALSDGADSASAGVALSAAAAAATAAARSARALELDAATATPPAKQKSIASSGRIPR